MSEDDEYRRSAAYDMVRLPEKVRVLERDLGELQTAVEKISKEREEERKTIFRYGLRTLLIMLSGMVVVIWNLLPSSAQDFFSMFTERRDR